MIDQLPPVLRAAQMREADRRTIEALGIPGFTLMENAGRAVAEEALCLLDDEGLASVVCLCGKGNNGGDGFVGARVLHHMGVEVYVCLAASPDDLTGDAAEHFSVLSSIAEREAGIHIRTVETVDELDDLGGASLYLDALLGTGLSSEVREPFADFVAWLNDRNAPVISVDVPSGLGSDDGRILGCAVTADVTVTMAALKAGLVVGRGPDCAGSVVVADIGIPHHILYDVLDAESATRHCADAPVRASLPARTRDAHKYATGPTLVFGGSPDFTGAPVLAATAAARVGSGYVAVVCPASVRDVLSEKLTEIPVASVPAQGKDWDFGRLIEDLGTRWEKARAILVGPGMGREDAARQLVLETLARAEAPVVVDADGLFALSEKRDFVRESAGGRWIFTPHAGEFKRLSGEVPDMAAARRFARDWNVVLLLKGMPSITASPDGTVVINDTGNPAAATAGSGDVLSGMVAGLVAQGIGPFEAAVAGVHIAGTIADAYASTRAVNSMMASDVLTMIPDYLSNRI